MSKERRLRRLKMLGDERRKLRSLVEELSSRLNIDALTGLYRRDYAIMKVGNLPHPERRKPPTHVLMMVDIDFFKEINDQHGHHAGDEALMAVGRVLKNSCRESDIPFRFGGDEFGILFLNIDVAKVDKKIDAIRQALEEVRVEGRQLTGSFGWCVVDPTIADDPYVMAQLNFRRADDALYASKRRGRNRITFYKEPIEKNV